MKINIANQKIILDVDTGVDDALAILVLAKLKLNQILGICTCGGNVPIEDTTKNTFSILSLLGKKIKVFRGASKNSDGENFHFARNYHGNNGLCGFEFSSKQKIENKSAVDFIIESANKYVNKLTLILLAPSTNLANALKKSPEIASKINQVIIMGGAVNVKGNETDFAEFNFYQDPKATKIIFENIKNIYLVPLDVTGKCLIEKEDLKKISNNNRISKFAISLIKKWYKIFGNPKSRFFELYDPLAASAILGDFLKFKKVKIDIETEGIKKGALIKNGRKKICYASQVNEKKFLNFFYKTINDFKNKMIIFDMDGTLYELVGGSYQKSSLRLKVRDNILKFISNEISKTKDEAKVILDRIQLKYGQQISIGLEKEYGIDRYGYFNKVWDISAKGIAVHTPGLKEVLKKLREDYKLIIVSDAPKIWINNVLKELEIINLFGQDVYSGESDNRKEFKNIFLDIIRKSGFKPENCISIGDQEKTDIIPAKNIGMKTIFVGAGRDCQAADVKIKNIKKLSWAINKIKNN